MWSELLHEPGITQQLTREARLLLEAARVSALVL